MRRFVITNQSCVTREIIITLPYYRIEILSWGLVYKCKGYQHSIEPYKYMDNHICMVPDDHTNVIKTYFQYQIEDRECHM